MTVAGEAAEPGAVIVLGELGAVAEQLGDAGDLQHDDDGNEDQPDRHDAHHDDAQPEQAAGALQEQAADQEDRRRREQAPGAAREGEEDAGGDDQQRHRVERHPGDAAGHQPVQHEDAGQHQERAEHVGILEGAGGAVVEREDLGAGKRIEIAGDAEDGGQDRRGEPGPEDQREQCRLRFGDRRVEDRGEGEEQRDRQIERRAPSRSDICVIEIMPPMLKVTSRTSSGTTGWRCAGRTATTPRSARPCRARRAPARRARSPTGRRRARRPRP